MGKRLVGCLCFAYAQEPTRARTSTHARTHAQTCTPYHSHCTRRIPCCSSSSTIIYCIFGCAARAVDARFPTQRPHGSCYRWEKERKKERKRGRKKKSERNYKEGGASAKMAFMSIWMNALSYAIVGPVWPSRLATETCITILLKSYNAM